MLKKLPYIFFILLFAMCKTPQLVSSSNNKNDSAKKENKKESTEIYYTEQTRNDFRSVSQKVQDKFLSDYNADEDGFAILFFTQGFNGEKVVVKNDEGTLFKGDVTTDKTTGLAKNMRIKSSVNTEIHDKETNKTFYINAKKAQKHKFVYVMKDSKSEKPYKITFSDKLRPAK